MGVQFERDQGNWFALILDSSIQGQGYGTKLLNMLKEQEENLFGWVIDHSNDLKQNGEPYHSPLAFYLKNGFNVNSEVRLITEKISAVQIEWNRSSFPI